jgi:hypothetical protein
VLASQGAEEITDGPDGEGGVTQPAIGGRRRCCSSARTWLIESSPNSPSTRSSTWSRLLTILAGPSPTLFNSRPAYSPRWNVSPIWRTGRTDFRLWVRVARTWTIVTTSDSSAITAAHVATNVSGSTADLRPSTRSRATEIL